MSHILRFLQSVRIRHVGGSIVYFVVVVTPGAFAVLTRDQAGPAGGIHAWRLHRLGLIAALVYLVAAIGLGSSVLALVRPAALGVALMLC